jgi:pilus assembly protein Flp/PilA
MIGIQKMTLAVQSIARLAVSRMNDRGATAVEYGLIVALIAAVIIVTVGLVGTDVNTAFDTVEKKLP